MLRAKIEQYMKEKNMRQIDLVYKKEDRLAVYCLLEKGTLKDYTHHVVKRNIDIWGCLKWANGKCTRISFEDLLKEGDE